MSEKRISVGGQAVIEGVMMRSPTYYATAVRTPQGSIVIQKIRFIGLTRRYKYLNIPILRGAINLVETLVVGVKSLSYSAEQAMEEGPRQQKRSWRSNLGIAGSVILAFAVGLGLFFYIPLLLTDLLRVSSGLAFNLIDGGFRLLIFLLYIIAVSRWKEMKRIFQYHGAEHKTIFAFEAGQDLSPDTIKHHSTLHPRCGTSFLLVVMIVSIIVFIFMGRPHTIGDRLLRFAMIPLIAGISFEIIKLSAKEKWARFCKLAVWPGLTLQKITTQEPSEEMLEVAIAALNACLDYQSVRLELPSS
jgi:uncharacterized protein YqhQ